MTTRRRMIVTLVLVLLISWGSLAAMLLLGWAPKLGLDLQGGFSVVLVSPQGTDEDTLQTAVEVMRRRIEELGSVQEPEIYVQGDRAIVVQLPGVEDRDRALRAVGTTGEMSFRPVLDIVAESPYFTDPEGEHPDNIDPETGLSDPDDVNQIGYLPAVDSFAVYVVGPAFLTGIDMNGGEAQFSGSSGTGGTGGWVVVPDFTADGGEKFRTATAVLAGYEVGAPQRQMAIVVDGEVQSSPAVASDVSPAEGLDPSRVVITIGSSSDNPQQEAEDLAAILKYGALPTTFERERVESVSATLGEDSLRAGLIAGLIGLVLVAVYMVVYYRVLGLLAVVGLSVFGALLVGAIILLGETQGTTLTLAGVTGIVVSIGITLDSSIVYFERIKEEYHAGRPLRSSIDHAFSGAFSTNLKGDTVTLMAAVLLWLLAIGPVKGFALTLGLATVIDVFVAWFYTRPAVWLAGHSGLIDGGWFSIRGAMGKVEEPSLDELVEVGA